MYSFVRSLFVFPVIFVFIFSVQACKEGEVSDKKAEHDLMSEGDDSPISEEENISEEAGEDEETTLGLYSEIFQDGTLGEGAVLNDSFKTERLLGDFILGLDNDETIVGYDFSHLQTIAEKASEGLKSMEYYDPNRNYAFISNRNHWYATFANAEPVVAFKFAVYEGFPQQSCDYENLEFKKNLKAKEMKASLESFYQSHCGEAKAVLSICAKLGELEVSFPHYIVELPTCSVGEFKLEESPDAVVVSSEGENTNNSNTDDNLHEEADVEDENTEAVFNQEGHQTPSGQIKLEIMEGEPDLGPVPVKVRWTFTDVDPMPEIHRIVYVRPSEKINGCNSGDFAEVTGGDIRSIEFTMKAVGPYQFFYCGYDAEHRFLINSPVKEQFSPIQLLARGHTSDDRGLSGINSFAIEFSGRHLYAAALKGEQSCVATFRINRDDFTLQFRTCLADSELQGPLSDLVVSSDARFVFAADSKGVMVFSRDIGSGELTKPTRVVELTGIHQLDFFADGRALALVTADKIYSFSLDFATGALKEKSSINSQGIESFLIAPGGEFIYANQGAHIDVYQRDLVADTLDKVQTVDLASGLNVASLQIAKSWDKLYVMVRASSQGEIITYNRDLETGQLAELQKHTFAEASFANIRRSAQSRRGRILAVATATQMHLFWSDLAADRYLYVQSVSLDSLGVSALTHFAFDPHDEAYAYAVNGSGKIIAIQQRVRPNYVLTAEDIQSGEQPNIVDPEFPGEGQLTKDGRFYIGHTYGTSRGNPGRELAVHKVDRKTGIVKLSSKIEKNCPQYKPSYGKEVVEGALQDCSDVGAVEKKRLLVSDDNRCLYLTSQRKGYSPFSPIILVFRIDRNSGQLSYVQHIDKTTEKQLPNDLAKIAKEQSLHQMALSRDGRHVYIPSAETIYLFDRNLETCELYNAHKNAAGYRAAFKSPDGEIFNSAAITRDGRHFYAEKYIVLLNINSGLQQWRRDVVSGELTFVETDKNIFVNKFEWGKQTFPAVSQRDDYLMPDSYAGQLLKPVLKRDYASGKIITVPVEKLYEKRKMLNSKHIGRYLFGSIGMGHSGLPDRKPRLMIFNWSVENFEIKNKIHEFILPNAAQIAAKNMKTKNGKQRYLFKKYSNKAVFLHPYIDAIFIGIYPYALNYQAIDL